MPKNCSLNTNFRHGYEYEQAFLLGSTMNGSISWEGNSGMKYADLLEDIGFKGQLRNVYVEYGLGNSGPVEFEIVFYPNLGFCKKLIDLDVSKPITIADVSSLWNESSTMDDINVILADKRTKTYFSIDHSSQTGDDIMLR